MSNFAKSHSMSTFQARKKSRKAKSCILVAKWLEADRIVDQVYCDIVKGIPNSEIILKFKNTQYEGQKKPIGTRQAYDYISSARDRLMYDFEAEMGDLRADLYGKMIAVYNDALKNNDRYNALIALDKIMKLTGVSNDKPQTAIQINSDKENGVTVNFGFDKKDED